jgi:dTDP-glucose 4,6-dehydratase
MDEISNLDLCSLLLKEFGHDPAANFDSFVQHTVDRPFNDRRYAVDATKLRELGWTQKTSFAEGLKITVDWYKEFGDEWWGNIDLVLVPFPVVKDSEVVKGDS